jgi:hypothetical protein
VQFICNVFVHEGLDGAAYLAVYESYSYTIEPLIEVGVEDILFFCPVGTGENT